MYFSRIRVSPEIFRSTQLHSTLSENSYNSHRLLWDLFTNEKKRTFLYREEIAREQLGTRSGVRGEPIYYVVSSTRPLPENPVFKVEVKEYHPQLQEGDRLKFELRVNPVVTKAGRKHDIAMDAQVTFLKSLCAEFNLQPHLPEAPQKKELKKTLITQGGRSLDSRLTEFLKSDFYYCERLQQTMQLRDKLEWSLKATIDSELKKWLVAKGAKHGFSIPKGTDDQYKLQSSAYRWQSIKPRKGLKSGFSSVDFTGELKVIDVPRLKDALFNGVGRSKAFGCGLMLVKRI